MATYTYTEANLTAVRAAKLALASGTRKVSFSIGDKSVTYGQTDMAALELLEQQIFLELQTATARPRFFLTSTGKGL